MEGPPEAALPQSPEYFCARLNTDNALSELHNIPAQKSRYRSDDPDHLA